MNEDFNSFMEGIGFDLIKSSGNIGFWVHNGCKFASAIKLKGDTMCIMNEDGTDGKYGEIEDFKSYISEVTKGHNRQTPRQSTDVDL